MSLTQIAFRDISFSYETSPKQLFHNLTVHCSSGFTGIVGPNGTGKTTLLQLAIGKLKPDSGTIEGSTTAIYCAQRTDSPPDTLQAMLDDMDGTAFALRGRLGIEDDYLDRWDTLSHGERKRTQIACALWQAPDLLAIDEPTNHIDAETRGQLISALARFNGVGLIVSHDRELLDELCDQCIWLSPPNASVYKGGYSACVEQRAAERNLQQKERGKAVKDRNRLRKEQDVRRRQADKAQGQLSKRHVNPKDHDAKAKINGAKLAGGSVGKRINQLDGRLDRAEKAVSAHHVTKEYETGIWLPGSISKRNNLLSTQPSHIPLGHQRQLHIPQLTIAPTDRIALVGPNGHGKSTLLNHLFPRFNVPKENLLYMPQEITREESRHILASTKSLARHQLGDVMNIVSRLGSRPEQLLASREPSPGEIRKLLLALGMSQKPHLLVLDEPTNHLDLPSIEALEAALQECPCAMILVSHDSRFLSALVQLRWELTGAANGDSELSTMFMESALTT